MTPGTAGAPRAAPHQTPAPCWRSVGVRGDHSCPELARVVNCHNCPAFARAALTLFDRPASARETGRQEADLPSFACGNAESESTLRKTDVDRIFVFTLGNNVCALDCAFVDEVACDAPIRRMAHRGGGLLEGLVNVRGELLLSVALDRLLGFKRTDPPVDRGDGLVVQRSRRVIIGGIDKQTWSFRTTEVLGVHSIARQDIEPVPMALPNPLDQLLRGLARLPANAVRSASAPMVVNILSGKALLAAFSQGV